MATTSSAPIRSPFNVDDCFRGSLGRVICRPLGNAIERLLGLAVLNRLYTGLSQDGRPFYDRALEALGVTLDVPEGETIRIPRSGPLVLVSNHPHGALDGLVLASLLRQARPDVKLLGNYLLGRIPELRDLCILVDPFGARSRVGSNAAALRSALRWLTGGGALAVFPSGEVSHEVTSDGETVDSAWTPTVAWLVQRAGATVVPIFVHGGTSRWFRLAGHLHPRLRTALLPRELLRQRGRRVALRIGSPIPQSRLEGLDGLEHMTSYLRFRTYALAACGRSACSSNPGSPSASSMANCPVAAAEPSDALRDEIAALPASQVLVRSGSFTVCYGRARELPHTLREIGRLRELAFRATGEGTGRERDLDEFDEHYVHLFAWNHDCCEIAGAYRIGPTDEILQRSGARGLYTAASFRYDRRLLEQIDPALELGRAFVRIEYQRDYSPLMLLWKGIGSFVSRNPRYRMLFGTVSISNTYQSVSRQLLARFLDAASYRSPLADLVKPRNPPAFLRSSAGPPPLVSAVVRSVAEVGALVAEIETDRKGLPVLLRQYLKLNAKLLGFNVDPAFANVLDGLMLVDLTEVDRTILTRYLGPSGAHAFLVHHMTDHRLRAS